MSDNSTILIIEDEEDLAELVAYHLKQDQFQTVVCARGDEGFQKALETLPQLIVLDLMIPGMSGIEVCRRLKSHPEGKHIPILILTARGEEIDRVVGFEMGADDYMVKPFSPRELVLRVKAILRRSESGNSSPAKKNSLGLWGIRLDPESHRVWAEKEEILLTATEFKLLEYLMKSRGRVLTRDLLLDQVWGYDTAITTRTVDTHVKRLREKLGEKAGEAIETVRGVGYRFKES